MTDSKDMPNVLFVVWDACRYDYAEEHASNLRQLAADNVWFRNAVPASNWSAPSHASLFSGQYPSGHRSYRFDDAVDPRPLLSRLENDGYRTYSVSANGFASDRTGFHRPFDESHYTYGEEVFQDGLGVYEYGHNSPKTGKSLVFDLLSAAVQHPKPLKSLVNVCTATTAAQVAPRYPLLQRLPHPLFAGESGYSYTGKKNNECISAIFEKESESDSPFFLFTNFMDTHHPYRPTSDSPELTYREVRRVNEEVADEWEFLARTANGGVDEADVDRVRELYRSEVETVDDYLGELLELLDDHGLRENTLVVVTADHGENLGEADRTGRRRMGHVASASQHLLRVPLVIAHPNLNGEEVERRVSLRKLFDLIANAGDVATGATSPTELLVEDRPVLAECPALRYDGHYERHPDVPDEVIAERVDEHIVAGYLDEWKIHLTSTGESHAWQDGEATDPSTAPDELLEACEEHLAALCSDSEQHSELSRDEVQQLEALGYL